MDDEEPKRWQVIGNVASVIQIPMGSRTADDVRHAVFLSSPCGAGPRLRLFTLEAFLTFRKTPNTFPVYWSSSRHLSESERSAKRIVGGAVRD